MRFVDEINEDLTKRADFAENLESRSGRKIKAHTTDCGLRGMKLGRLADEGVDPDGAGAAVMIALRQGRRQRQRVLGALEERAAAFANVA